MTWGDKMGGRCRRWVVLLLLALAAPLAAQPREGDERPARVDRAEMQERDQRAGVRPEDEPAPEPERAPILLGEVVEEAAAASIIGRWAGVVGTQRVRLAFDEDGAFRLSRGERVIEDGVYRVRGNMLELESQRRQVQYKFQRTKDQFTLSGGDLVEPVAFIPEMGWSFRWLWDISAASARRTLARILMIVVVVVVARLVILLLQIVSDFLVRSNFGPLRLLYRRSKNRTRTIHSLTLNLIKYVVYFSALGFILSEIGVEYTTYLASLSVIGLAIGFGSQGLVQDMVTGFFIIFESQFDVGDMVEVSGQTGIVEELGLRMTKLRNYQGQTVVIPNRNIAVVGNYRRGAAEAYVDVRVESRETALALAPAIQRVADQVCDQYEEVVLGEPRVLPEPDDLPGGEHVARLHVAFWPGQQWVVEQQLVPRLRTALATQGTELPPERLSTYYHVRPQRHVFTWRWPAQLNPREWREG